VIELIFSFSAGEMHKPNVIGFKSFKRSLLMQCGEMWGEIVCVLCSTVVIKCTSGLSWLTVQIGREFMEGWC
jgi:hypothetical protein